MSRLISMSLDPITERSSPLSTVPDLEPAVAGSIPVVASINDEARDYASEIVVFSFSDYNPKECGLRNFDKKFANGLTSKLRLMSGLTVQGLIHSYFKDKVEDGGQYAGLYEGLGQDIELYEIEYAQKGRIFGYIAQNRLHVVAFDFLRHK